VAQPHGPIPASRQVRFLAHDETLMDQQRLEEVPCREDFLVEVLQLELSALPLASVVTYAVPREASYTQPIQLLPLELLDLLLVVARADALVLVLLLPLLHKKEVLAKDHKEGRLLARA